MLGHLESELPWKMQNACVSDVSNIFSIWQGLFLSDTSYIQYIAAKVWITCGDEKLWIEGVNIQSCVCTHACIACTSLY